MSNIYTYIVDHGNERPRVGASSIINGGKLEEIMFDNALEKLREMEEFLTLIRAKTMCNHTKNLIDGYQG